ncbi:hypothetical protein [Streptomyces sp. MZ04]|uniref:hypothetical protein n=1 Tax=Streptomyces sp. MZ04 TaxID=2559236 RepID=UPI0032AF48FA
MLDTTGLDEAEQRCRDICGTSEIDYERTKATRLMSIQTTATDPASLRTRLREFQEAALGRGATHATFRRVAEELVLRGETRHEIAKLITSPSSGVWKLST